MPFNSLFIVDTKSLSDQKNLTSQYSFRFFVEFVSRSGNSYATSHLKHTFRVKHSKTDYQIVG